MNCSIYCMFKGRNPQQRNPTSLGVISRGRERAVQGGPRLEVRAVGAGAEVIAGKRTKVLNPEILLNVFGLKS